ncbi:unnamed protein product [Amoebophrya sp. A120]|nr:unnamed protein product [Amoebophrya sp. A120]|eukprot:GSA120T00013248001.1
MRPTSQSLVSGRTIAGDGGGGPLLNAAESRPRSRLRSNRRSVMFCSRTGVVALMATTGAISLPAATFVAAQEMFPKQNGNGAAAAPQMQMMHQQQQVEQQQQQQQIQAQAQQASAQTTNFDHVTNLLLTARQRSTSQNLSCAPRESDNPGSNVDPVLNVFMMWPGSPETFLTESYATLESVLFHHPNANIYVLNLPDGFFAERYNTEAGYCVFSVPLDWNVIRDIIFVALGKLHSGFSLDMISEFLYTMQNTPDPPLTMGVVWNALIFSLQHLFGGLFIPLDGLLVGAIDQFLDSKIEKTLVFTERILPEKLPWGLKFEEVKQPRSPTDLADLETGICGDVQMCLRHIPLGHTVGREYVHFIVDQVRNWKNGSPDLEKFGTEKMRSWMTTPVQELENPNSLSTDGTQQTAKLTLLPHWVIQEPTFADGYNAHILVGPEKQTELYTPRFQRSSSDWTLVSTAKLWLPLRYGQISSRNALRWSVMDSALLLQSLHLSPYPYRTAFYNHDWEKHYFKDNSYHLLIGISDQYRNFAQSGLNETIQAGISEGAYPGIVGGFRTFGRIRVVGRSWKGVWKESRALIAGDSQQQTTQPANNNQVAVTPPKPEDAFPYSGTIAETQTPNQLRLRITVNKNVEFFCRNAAISSQYEWKDEKLFEKCENALTSSSAGAAGISYFSSSRAAPKNVFNFCGTSQEINSIVRMLSYRGNFDHQKELLEEEEVARAAATALQHGMIDQPEDAQNNKIREKINQHYGTASFTLFQNCKVEDESYENLTLDQYKGIQIGEKLFKQQQMSTTTTTTTTVETTETEEMTPLPGILTGPVNLPQPGGALSAKEIEEKFGHLERKNVLDFRTVQILLDNPEEVITIAAHSASRCWMLDRMEVSLKTSYPNMKIIGTCECAEEDPVCDPTPIKKSDILTIYPVPYDFGLSQGKTRLTNLVTTKYLLILDDDFVRTHHTCIECMLAKMYSYWHTSFLPLDLVGFPVLEDERNFGAYRGKFRLQNTALFLEPFYHQNAPDGCIRVDFCPMVYLARKARMATFEWKKELKVGEHEYFFYTNKLKGIQTGVCFDSSFAHARHKPSTAVANYQGRRDRFLDLMMGAFGVGGITRVMYLFRTYQMTETKDFDELADREVAPWDISDDTCGPSQEPVAPFVVLFVALLSAPENSKQRIYLRTKQNSWLQKLKQMGQLSYSFIVPGDPSQTPGVLQEQATYNDMIFAPHVEWIPKVERDSYQRKYNIRDSGMSPVLGQPLNQEFGGGLLRFLFEFLRKRFQFRWVLIQNDDVYLHLGTFLDALSDAGEPENKIIGNLFTEPALAPEQSVDGVSFVLSRDLFQVMTQATFLSRAIVATTITGTINKWLMPFEVQKIQIPYAKFRLKGNECPMDAAFLHPVHSEAMEVMDYYNQPNEPPCSVFYRDQGDLPGAPQGGGRAEL